MKTNRRMHFALCLTLFTLLSGCVTEESTASNTHAHSNIDLQEDPAQNKAEESSSAVSHSASAAVPDDATWEAFTPTGESTRSVSAEQVKQIAANTSYADIIALLGETEDFMQRGLRQYLVDDTDVLILNFSDGSEICPLSGAELLATTKPYRYPKGEVPQLDAYSTTVYGVIVNHTKLVSAYEADVFTMETNDAEIVFENGKPATEADLTCIQAVLVTYDSMAESYPGQAHCTKVVILQETVS